VSLELQPVTQREAFRWIEEVHSTHGSPPGSVYQVAVNNGEEIVGVAIAGRPPSRHYDDGWTLEVTRVATDGYPNAASKLYGACTRAAWPLGYERVITYTVTETEDAIPLKATHFKEVRKDAGGGSWDREDRPRVDEHPTGNKTLWEATP
jgi:hypothetical protein